jgi:hypothetical protein
VRIEAFRFEKAAGTAPDGYPDVFFHVRGQRPEPGIGQSLKRSSKGKLIGARHSFEGKLRRDGLPGIEISDLPAFARPEANCVEQVYGRNPADTVS